MSTEQFSAPQPEIVDTLRLREQVLVHSARAIDEQRDASKKQITPIGQWAWADWIDPTGGMNFRLEELTERVSPETVFSTYNLRGYYESIDDPSVDFSYDSYGTRIYRRDEQGKYRRCKRDNQEMLLHCLESASAEREEEINATNKQFDAIMRASKIPNQDPRFRAELKRTFASGILRLLGR